MKFSFRMYLFRWFLLVALIPILLISFLSYYYVQQEIDSRSNETMTLTNESVYNIVDTQQRILSEWLPSAANSFVDKLEFYGESHFEYEEMVELGGYNIPTWYIGDQKITLDNTFVDGLIESEKLPASIFMLYDHKFLRVSTNVRQDDGVRITGTNLSSGPVYDRLINGQSFLGRASVEGIMHATVYTPIRDEDGQLIGAFVLGRREQEYEMIKAIKKISFSNSGYVFIIDSDGQMIHHPNLDGQDVSNLEWIQEIIGKQNGEITYTFEGRQKVAFYTYYEPWDWYIISGGYVSDIYETSSTVFRFIVTIVLISIGMMIFISYSISSRIMKPINNITNSIKAINNGDMTSRFYSTNNNEFGVLSYHYNQMVLKFETFLRRLAVQSNGLKESSSRLMSDISRTENTLSGIEQRVDGLRKNVKERRNPVFDRDLIKNINMLDEQLASLKELPDITPFQKTLEMLKHSLVQTSKFYQIDQQSGQTEYKEQLNQTLNNLYIENQKLKILLENISSSAHNLDESASLTESLTEPFKIDQ